MFNFQAAPAGAGRMFAVWLAFSLGVFEPVHAEPPGRSKPFKSAPGSVQVSFLPPPLADAAYSVGIYESKTGRLVRRLHESAPDEAFTAGLNGFITHWDRKDESGKTVPAGKYTARGWAVGEKLAVEGVDVIGNGWTDEDEDLRVVRVEAICLMPGDDGLAVLATMAGNTVELLRIVPAEEGRLLWRHNLAAPPVKAWASAPRLSAGAGTIYVDGGKATRAFAAEDGHETGIEREEDFTLKRAETPSPAASAPSCPGRDGSRWVVAEAGLTQLSASGETLRQLPVTPPEPAPRAVSASEKADRLYLWEETEGWQRVRGLEWLETKQENGQPVSEWKTFFERSIRRPDPALGLEDPATAKAASPVVELPLARNPLEPGKRQSGRLRAGFDEKGSYLETADGLRLRQISERPNLRAVKLVKGKAAGALTFYQTDGAAWDEFALTGVPASLMAFDAGEFELTATGEKHPEGAATEPRDL